MSEKSRVVEWGNFFCHFLFPPLRSLLSATVASFFPAPLETINYASSRKGEGIGNEPYGSFYYCQNNFSKNIFLRLEKLLGTHSPPPPPPPL